MRIRTLVSTAVVSLAAAAALTAGCGGAGDVDQAGLDNGKAQFTKNCGSCHTLEAAGTKGNLGPNLDDAFRGARQQGFKDSEFDAVVREWIQLAPQPPDPGSEPVAMPRDLVTGQDAKDVAAFVAKNAGTTPESTVRPLQPEVRGQAPKPYVWEGKDKKE